MTAFIAQNFVSLMFCGLFFFLLTGIPVAFGLAATGLVFGFIGMEAGLFGSNLFQALPQRVFAIMSNETLLAIPFFTFMGIILERSGMAEDLLETVGQVFGPVRGGVAIAVILVGALLAATTGVVAAAVISMGLISLPIMLRYGYNRSIATGTITASGTLAQAIPPSLVLIVLADQLGRSVGDMYQGAFIPGLVLTGLYAGYVFLVTMIYPKAAPALPLDAITIREADGRPGYLSLLVAVAGTVAFAYVLSTQMQVHGIWSAAAAGIGLYVLAYLNKLLKLGLLSKLAQQVIIVMMPPLGLIFLVLGTIFLGIATPTEGGAMGAMGALVMAIARRRIDFKLLRQAMDSTMKLSCFVLFILVGATVFSLAFQGADGPVWVEHLLTGLPGGQLGFLIVVNILVFLLAFFLDFFELAFIIVPLVGPVAEKMGIDLVWFGVLLAVNMQTSFMHPPFGFALFYLRSVAPVDDYTDKVTKKPIKKVTIEQIYWGSVPFVLIQIIMVGLIIAFPGIVSTNTTKGPTIDADKVLMQMEKAPKADPAPAGADGSAPATTDSDKEDPMKGLLESIKSDQGKKP